MIHNSKTENKLPNNLALKKRTLLSAKIYEKSEVSTTLSDTPEQQLYNGSSKQEPITRV